MASEPLLDPLQITQFHEQGYLILRQFVDAERQQALRKVVQADLSAALDPVEYEAEVAYPGAPASLEAEGGKTIRRLRGAYQRAPSLRAWAEQPQLISALHQLLEDEVVLTLAHHNCVMTKHPHYGTATGWHRDIRYWSYAHNNLISVWLALGEEHAANGGLLLIPGSHRLQLERSQLDELDFLRPDASANLPLFKQGIALHLQAGDVVLFHSGLFHAAGRNESERIKTSVVFAYRGASNPPTQGSRSAAAGEVPL